MRYIILIILFTMVSSLRAGYKVNVGVTMGEVENADTIWVG